MTLGKAVEILKHHNDWRKGAEIEMIDPELISQAVDMAIEVMKDVKDGNVM